VTAPVENPPPNQPTARDVIVDALTARHEELSGEASPRDFDGARQILRALAAAGYRIVEADAMVCGNCEATTFVCGACGTRLEEY
jgi:hypothetical protein